MDEQDIGAKVIGAGLALDCSRFSGGRYAEYELKGAASQMKLPGCFDNNTARGELGWKAG